MSTTVPAKIVLKSTTKVTLSERFTQIQKMRPPPPSAQEVRVQMASHAHASQQNRRLAQQMANRPAVQAALGGNRQQVQHVQQVPQLKKNKSLKQRLGPTNVKARLSLVNNTNRGMGQQRGRGRGGRGGGVMNGFNRGGPVRGGRGGRGTFNRGGGRGVQRWREHDDFYPRGRGGFGRPGNQYFGRGGGRGRGNPGGFRGQRGGGQRGRGSPRGRGGRGAGRGGPNKNFTREQLDNQLEEYMSKTKAHLNADLDDYMSNADM